MNELKLTSYTAVVADALKAWAVASVQRPDPAASPKPGGQAPPYSGIDEKLRSDIKAVAESLNEIQLKLVEILYGAEQKQGSRHPPKRGDLYKEGQKILRIRRKPEDDAGDLPKRKG